MTIERDKTKKEEKIANIKRTLHSAHSCRWCTHVAYLAYLSNCEIVYEQNAFLHELNWSCEENDKLFHKCQDLKELNAEEFN